MFTLVTATAVERHMLTMAGLKRETEAMVIEAGRFDQKSTQKDRAAALELVLGQSRGASGLGPADGALAEEELNALLARTQTEFDAFQRWDSGERLPLLTYDEIPAFVRYDSGRGRDNDGQRFEGCCCFFCFLRPLPCE